MKSVIFVVLLMLYSTCIGQSPSIKLVRGFIIQGESAIHFQGEPDYRSFLFYWVLDAAEYPIIGIFRTVITPYDEMGTPLSVGGIQFSFTKIFSSPPISGAVSGSAITPNGIENGKTDKNGNGYVCASLCFSSKVSASARYDIKICGRTDVGKMNVYFDSFRPLTFWEQYGISWRCYSENLNPDFSWTSKSEEMFEMLEQNITTNEVWKIQKTDCNEVVDSLISLPSVDVNGFEKVATPYYVEFETDSTLPKIQRILVGSRESYGIYAYRVSGNTYRTEYLVPVEDVNDTRLYVDPNGVVYNFIHTDDVFNIETLGDSETLIMIYRLFEEWLMGYCRSDINWDGIVNLKDFSILANRMN